MKSQSRGVGTVSINRTKMRGGGSNTNVEVVDEPKHSFAWVEESRQQSEIESELCIARGEGSNPVTVCGDSSWDQRDHHLYGRSDM